MRGESQTSRSDFVHHASVRVDRIGSEQDQVDQSGEGRPVFVRNYPREDPAPVQVLSLAPSFPARSAFQNQYQARTSASGDPDDRPTH